MRISYPRIIPTKQERCMRADEFIVSKTNPNGIITYCNPVFMEFSGYTEIELLGQQHNIIRHPDMPRTVFSLLWQTIKSGDEFIGYIKNMAKDGSYYWVHATVTPSFSVEKSGIKPEIIGYFSVRRQPEKSKVAILEDIYHKILSAEKAVSKKEQILAGTEVLNEILQNARKSYHEFIDTL